jgi:hypothetical protein
MERPMSQPSTISLKRPAPKIATITFSDPPVNLIAGETVTRLHELVVELGGDPGIQVAVFKSLVGARRLSCRQPLRAENTDRHLVEEGGNTWPPRDCRAPDTCQHRNLTPAGEVTSGA